MTNERKLELIAETLDRENDIEPGMILSDLPEWDSMAKLSLIVMLDDECGKTITGAQIRELKTVQDIMNCMD